MSKRVPNLKVKNKTVSQVLDVAKIFGIKKADESLKQAVAQWAIEKIRDRTRSGKDAFGNSMGKYSESYKNSDAFKAAGKTNRVDLYLTGEMLETIDVISSKGNEIEIGWNDDTNNGKAYGHQTGFDGHPFLDGEVDPRPFFGITEDDFKTIKKEFTVPASDLKNEDILNQLKNIDSTFKKVFSGG